MKIGLAIIVALCIACMGLSVLSAQRMKLSDEKGFMREYLSADDTDRQSIALKYSRGISFTRMLALLDSNNPICHVEAHAIGRAVYISTNSATQSLEICKKSCSDGCFHGLQMGLFGTTPDSIQSGDVSDDSLANIVIRGSRFCAMKETMQHITPWKCIHGLGHAIVVAVGYDLRRGIDACQYLPDAQGRGLCASGIFMEFMLRYDVEKAIANQPYFPCDSYPELSSRCYRYKAKHMVALLGSAGAKDACLKLPNETAQACVKGLGFAQARKVMLRQTGGLDTICKDFTGALKSKCEDGAISLVALNTEDASDEGCADLSLDYRARCEAMLDEVRSYVPQTL